MKAIFFIVYEFFVAPLLGAPGARGPLFIEPPEPPVSTPLVSSVHEWIKSELFWDNVTLRMLSLVARRRSHVMKKVMRMMMMMRWDAAVEHVRRHWMITDEWTRCLLITVMITVLMRWTRWYVCAWSSSCSNMLMATDYHHRLTSLHTPSHHHHHHHHHCKLLMLMVVTCTVWAPWQRTGCQRRCHWQPVNNILRDSIQPSL